MFFFFFKLNFQLQTIEEENTGRLSCSCVIVLKKVSAIMHQAGIFSQCQGSINSVSLGIEAHPLGNVMCGSWLLADKRGKFQ